MAGTIFPYGVRIPTPAYASLLHGSQVPGEVQRAHAAQLYDLSARIRLGLPFPAPGLQPAIRPFDPLQYLYGQQDPRNRFFHEEPKPTHSYIGLIAMAILSAKEKKLILSDIYQWIIDNYPYFRTRGTGWRNSIRHNLSLNDCFIKAGRAANGKGHFWAVHSAVVDDFERGDFRRRRAQRKVRKAMGLAVPDEEDSPSPPPPSAETIEWRKRMLALHHSTEGDSNTSTSPPPNVPAPPTAATMPSGPPAALMHPSPPVMPVLRVPIVAPTSRKRGFDVASLLAPDDDDVSYGENDASKRRRLSEDEEEAAASSDVDVEEDPGHATFSSTSTSNSSMDRTSPGKPAEQVMSPWSRPSAFHSFPTASTAWRPFLPTAFPLLRCGPPSGFLPMPQTQTRLIIPISPPTHQHPRDDVPCTDDEDVQVTEHLKPTTTTSQQQQQQQHQAETDDINHISP